MSKTNAGAPSITALPPQVGDVSLRRLYDGVANVPAAVKRALIPTFAAMMVFAAPMQEAAAQIYNVPFSGTTHTDKGDESPVIANTASGMYLIIRAATQDGDWETVFANAQYLVGSPAADKTVQDAYFSSALATGRAEIATGTMRRLEAEGRLVSDYAPILAYSDALARNDMARARELAAQSAPFAGVMRLVQNHIEQQLSGGASAEIAIQNGGMNAALILTEELASGYVDPVVSAACTGALQHFAARYPYYDVMNAYTALSLGQTAKAGALIGQNIAAIQNDTFGTQTDAEKADVLRGMLIHITALAEQDPQAALEIFPILEQHSALQTDIPIQTEKFTLQIAAQAWADAIATADHIQALSGGAFDHGQSNIVDSLATALEANGQWELAITTLHDFIGTQSPIMQEENSMAHDWVMSVLLNKAASIAVLHGGELDRAKEDIELSLAYFPFTADAIATHAQILLQTGHYGEAAEEFKRAMGLDDDPETIDADLVAAIPSVNEGLGDAYFHTGQTGQAMLYWQRALALNATTPDPAIDAAALRLKIDNARSANPAAPEPEGNGKSIQTAPQAPLKGPALPRGPSKG